MSATESPAKTAIIAVAWPYANGDLHLGHPAGYLLPADLMNRYLRMRGRDVVMVSGSDMHGTPIAVKAWEEGEEPAVFAERQHLRHIETMKKLGMEYSLYTATNTALHQQVVQQIFLTLEEKGFISKKEQELYWSESEHKFLLDRYIEGECPHCGYDSARGDQCDNCGRTLTPDELVNPYSIFGDKKLAKKQSTNYFLDLDKLQPLLEEHYQSKDDLDNWRRHVVATTQSWLDEGLQPRAITRDMEGYGVQLPLGHEVNGEEGKVLYVWFEAVCGYLTAVIELSERHQANDRETKQEDSGNILLEKVRQQDLPLQPNKSKFYSDTYLNQSLQWQDYWFNEKTDSYYFMGKDNIPFHAIIWTAILLGLNEGEEKKLVLPTNIPANQYLNLKGAKFSKSKNNVIDTKNIIDKYGLTTVRYFLITRMPENKDYNFTWQEFVDATNNELVANIGNLINRTLVFWNKYFADADLQWQQMQIENQVAENINSAYANSAELLQQCKYVEAFRQIQELASFGNKYFNDSEIWQVVKKDEQAAGQIMYNLLQIIANLANLLQPFLPDLSTSVFAYLGSEKPQATVGEDYWQKIEFEPLNVGHIADLKPLINKLELEQILDSE
jgi:methionyl-tRNA synthetase